MTKEQGISLMQYSFYSLIWTVSEVLFTPKLFLKSAWVVDAQPILLINPTNSSLIKFDLIFQSTQDFPITVISPSRTAAAGCSCKRGVKMEVKILKMKNSSLENQTLPLQLGLIWDCLSPAYPFLSPPRKSQAKPENLILTFPALTEVEKKCKENLEVFFLIKTFWVVSVLKHMKKRRNPILQVILTV